MPNVYYTRIQQPIFFICKPKTESKMAATRRIRLFVGAEVVNTLQVIIKMNEN